MKKTRSTKVLFSSLNFAPEETGIGPYSTDLVKWLGDRAEFDVTVLAAHPHYPQWRIADGYGQWRLRRRELNADIHRLRHYVPTRPNNLRRVVAELSFGLRVLFSRWGTPQIVITVTPSLLSSALAVFKARCFGRPVIVWVQDLYSVGLAERAEAFSAKPIRFIESATLRNATAVVVIHDRFRDTVADSFDVPGANIKVVRNWTHLQDVRKKTRASARAIFGWDEEFIVLHTGAQGVKQGLTQFIDLASSLAVELPNVRWILVGDGSQHEELVERVQYLDTIEMWSHLESGKYEDALTAADALLVSEAVGVGESAVPSKLTSYFSAGLPVLGMLNDTSITRSEIESAGAGVVFEHSQAGLRSAISFLLGDPAAAQEMGKRGLLFRRKHMSRESCCAEMATLIREVSL